jgi:hypothetical protein
MNTSAVADLEGRLREALAERATHSPIDPDAWDKTVARSRRSRLARFRPTRSRPTRLLPIRLRPSRLLPVPPRWLPSGLLPSGLLLPVGAAVAVVTIVLASIALTGGHPATRPGVSPSDQVPGQLPPGAAKLIRNNPPYTALVTVTDGPATLVFWFSHRKSPAVCFYASGGPGGAMGSCPPVEHSVAGEPVFHFGSYDSIELGVITPRATSVTVLLTQPNGIITGRLVSGRGFPQKVWLVNYPEPDNGTIVFRDAAGHQVVSFHLVHLVIMPPPSRPAHGGIVVDGWTAYLIDGRVAWWGPSDAPVVRELPWIVKRQPLIVTFQATTPVDFAVGYTPADVARLALRFPDGATYAAPTVAGWPGTGIRLWVRPGMPWNGIPLKTLVISYNAAGHIIAEQTLSSLLDGT